MISCELHDYIEIACMYRLPVLLELKNGERYQGTATDIKLDGNGHECLLLEGYSSQRFSILLNELKQMRARIKNPHFDIVNF